MPKKKVPDYVETKLRALEILDSVTQAELVKLYTVKYNAKTALFKVLFIGPERLFTMAEEVNESVAIYPGHRNITGNALSTCKTVGDFISKYCATANVPVTSGEPT